MLAALCPAVPARASAASSSSLHGSNPMEGSLQTLMFHVHKAGGTALCDLAKKNGESISEYNCNLDDASKYGFSCDRDQASAQSADEQGAYLRTVVRYTFGADECLAPREPVAGVITLTSLRQPLERAASHFYYDAMYGNAEATRGDCSSFDCFVLQRMESDDYAKYYWHNYMTRFFSGTAHTGAIGERELESAKARLSGVDVLIDLNNYEASGLPVARPNTMNNYGVILNSIGMERTMDALQRVCVRPLAAETRGSQGWNLWSERRVCPVSQ